MQTPFSIVLRSSPFLRGDKAPCTSALVDGSSSKSVTILGLFLAICTRTIESATPTATAIESATATTVQSNSNQQQQQQPVSANSSFHINHKNQQYALLASHGITRVLYYPRTVGSRHNRMTSSIQQFPWLLQAKSSEYAIASRKAKVEEELLKAFEGGIKIDSLKFRSQLVPSKRRSRFVFGPFASVYRSMSCMSSVPDSSSASGIKLVAGIHRHCHHQSCSSTSAQVNNLAIASCGKMLMKF